MIGTSKRRARRSGARRWGGSTARRNGNGERGSSWRGTAGSEGRRWRAGGAHSSRLSLIRGATLLAPRAHTTVLADFRPTALLAPRAHTTVLADSRPTALLARRAYTTVLADSSPTALLAGKAYTTVLADSRPTALLAVIALTTVGTSVAHLALRPGLHPVLAWPLCGRGPLPLRPLARRVLRHPDIDVLIWEHLTHVRPPNRWHPPPRPV